MCVYISYDTAWPVQECYNIAISILHYIFKKNYDAGLLCILDLHKMSLWYFEAAHNPGYYIHICSLMQLWNLVSDSVGRVMECVRTGCQKEYLHVSGRK